MTATLKGAAVRRLRLRPGDHIVLISQTPISGYQADNLREQAQQRWPDNPVTVLDRIDITVLVNAPAIDLTA